MTKKEFIEQAVLKVGAALVKVIDESENGVLNSRAQQRLLAENAWSIADEIADVMTEKGFEFE